LSRFTDWVSNTYYKFNPAQPAISRNEPVARPESIITWVTAYDEIDIVQRCVGIIINACVKLPFDVTHSSSTESERGPLKTVNNLLNKRPNPFEDQTRLFRRAYLDFMLDGNAFFYYDKDSRHLHVLPANDVEVHTDPVTFVSKYVYTIGGTTGKEDDSVAYIPFGSDFTSPTRGQARNVKEAPLETIEFAPDEIIHIKDDSSSSMFRGTSRLKSLNELLKLYDALRDFQTQFFENNAVPGLVLKTEAALSEKVKDRLLASWRKNYTSVFSGIRSPAILDNGLEIDKFSDINFEKLDFENSVKRLQKDIAKALGVPYVLLESEGSTNLDAAQVVFFELTILPIVEQFSSAFEFYWLNLDIIPEIKDVKALQPDLRTQSQLIASMVNGGVMTPNEGREKMGMEPSKEKDMDKIRVPENITGSATDPGQGGRPANSEVDEIPEDAAENGE
jgi:HK97 family phage portal protein